ncbi:MAG: DegT/DnrJ/EryC1/StrS family aminotransferase [Candidatus Eisenbacteria bacterium]|nr:DegT/DnrJ/EryC1/StrS family aminotransferase [Candidatus Eisenbacteria bacterium]
MPLACPSVGKEEVEALKNVIASGWLSQGEQVEKFERKFAAYVGVEHAVAFMNGTVALHSILLALGIGRGDEVIVPSLTFFSTATSVIHAGGTPVFAEVDPESFNLDPSDVERKITKKTKAVMPVHYGGQPADMKEILEIAGLRNLLVIEDAAQAHGASYKGKKAGSFGDAAMFSFTPTKNITAGEGGMVTTGDGSLAAKLRLLRNHGQEKQYHHVVVGYNYRMTELQAAVGIEQLKKLDSINKKKNVNARYLSEKLSKFSGIVPPAIKNDRTHPFTLYTLKIEEALTGFSRTELAEWLGKKGISSKVYFPPVHLQPALRYLGYGPDSLPITEGLAAKILSLPCHPSLKREDLEFIVSSVEALWKSKR